MKIKSGNNAVAVAYKKQEHLKDLGQNAHNQYGVRISQPLTAKEETFAGGQTYHTATGDVKIYDGKIREVDMAVFGKQLAEVERKEKVYLDFIKKIISGGNDKLLKAVIGKNINYCPELKGKVGDDNNYGRFVNLAKADGMEDVTQIETLAGGNALPSFLKFSHPQSEEFQQGVMKLKFICEHSGINFSNVNMVEPEVLAVKVGTSTNAVSGGYDFDDKKVITEAEVPAKRAA